MALAVAGSTTDGFVDHRRIPLPAGWLFANWRLVRRQRPNSPSSGTPGAWRGAADGGGRAVVETGDNLFGVGRTVLGVFVGTGDTFWAGWPVVVWFVGTSDRLWGHGTGHVVSQDPTRCPRSPRVAGRRDFVRRVGIPSAGTCSGGAQSGGFGRSLPPLGSPVPTGPESTAALPRQSHIMDKSSQSAGIHSAWLSSISRIAVQVERRCDGPPGFATLGLGV